MKNRDGFSLVELILIVVVVVIVGAVGYLAYTNFFANKPTPTKGANTAETSSQSAQKVVVNDSKDLDSALSALDKVSVSDGDSTQLNSAAGTF